MGDLLPRLTVERLYLLDIHWDDYSTAEEYEGYIMR